MAATFNEVMLMSNAVDAAAAGVLFGHPKPDLNAYMLQFREKSTWSREEKDKLLNLSGQVEAYLSSFKQPPSKRVPADLHLTLIAAIRVMREEAVRPSATAADWNGLLLQVKAGLEFVNLYYRG